MVIGLLVIAGIPTTIGVCEALSAQKKADNAAKEKAKFHLTARVSLGGGPEEECWVVLKEGRLWLDHPDHGVAGHKFTGYYFTYPSEAQQRGLVSTVADEPPVLNWIYVDKDSHMVCHGGRQATLGHTVGSWSWTEDERWLTLEDRDSGFAAVQTDDGTWAVAWDWHPDGGAGADACAWAPLKLQRRMQLGMESRYVKGRGAGADGGGGGSSSGGGGGGGGGQQ